MTKCEHHTQAKVSRGCRLPEMLLFIILDSFKKHISQLPSLVGNGSKQTEGVSEQLIKDVISSIISF